MALKINKGQRFNSLTVIKEANKYILPSGQTNRAFLCMCDCGREKVVRLAHLTRGRIKTCNNCRTPNVLEGENRIFIIWKAMNYRCRDNYIDSHLYYNKGVYVCKDWLDYQSFRDWSTSNGYSDGLCIDRKNGNGIYEPSNCRWTTPLINANNRIDTFYVEYNGEKIAFMLLLRGMGIAHNNHTIRARLKRGWSVEKAIHTPIRKGRYSKSNFMKKQEIKKELKPIVKKKVDKWKKKR